MIKIKIKIKDKGMFIFKVASIVMIVSILCILSYRFIHYYKIYNARVSDSSVNMPLHKKVLNNLYASTNVAVVNNNYYVTNNENKNYVNYSGILWQIIKINADSSITLISVDNINVLTMNNSMKDSNIDYYLNNEFYNELDSPLVYLKGTDVCLDEISDLNNITCEVFKTFNVGILSLSDYKNSGGIESFINIKKNFWISNSYGEEHYYISSEGNVSETKVLNNFGVRPVITISESVIYNAGDGSLNNPYIVGEKTADVLYQKNIGEYVKYNNETWRIVSKTEEGVKIVLNGFLNIDNNFDNYNNEFNNSSIFNYLNNTYYNSLDNKKIIVKGTWYTGFYSPDKDYDYQKIYDSKIKAYIGLLNVIDPFVLDINNTYTMTRSNNYNKSVFVINENHDIYSDLVSTKYRIRPALYLEANTKIIEGLGTTTSPYILEVT